MSEDGKTLITHTNENAGNNIGGNKWIQGNIHPENNRPVVASEPALTGPGSLSIFLGTMTGQKRIGSLDVIVALAIGGLGLTSLYSYALFHSLAEIVRISVAVAVFMLVWNVRGFLDNGYLKFISVAYVFICALDILHLFSYKEVGLVFATETNVTIQLWTGTRYLEGASLIAASFFLGRKTRLGYIFAGFLAASWLLVETVLYWQVFPTCFVEGAGLTSFKTVSNYIVGLLFLAAIGRLIQKRRRFDPAVLRFLVTAIAFTFLSELCLYFNIRDYGIPFLLGHLFKIVSFYFLYKSIIEMGLAKPMDVLFRDLKLTGEALTRARDGLEARVEQRTEELAEVNESLQQEIKERRRIEEALRRSETKYRTVADNTYSWEWWRDPEGKFVYVSPSCRRITGHAPDEFTADPGLLLRLIHPDDRPSFSRHQLEVEEAMTAGEIEFRILRPDGSVRWLAHACQPVFDEHGHRLGRRGSNRDITERKRAEESLWESERQLRALSSQMLTAQETERRRIARELHDEMGGALAVLKLRTSQVERNLPDSQSDLKEELRRNMTHIDELIENARRLSRDLSPSILEDIGLSPALRWLVENFARNFQIPVDFDIINVDHLFPKDSQIMIYRIFQEALANVGKHAQAAHVSARVRLNEDTVSFMVEDDGRGFDLKSARGRDDPERGMGLATMDERARMLGGSLEIRSEAGQGTQVSLLVPLRKGEN